MSRLADRLLEGEIPDLDDPAGGGPRELDALNIKIRNLIEQRKQAILRQFHREFKERTGAEFRVGLTLYSKWTDERGLIINSEPEIRDDNDSTDWIQIDIVRNRCATTYSWGSFAKNWPDLRV
jgi:hypothetical protein